LSSSRSSSSSPLFYQGASGCLVLSACMHVKCKNGRRSDPLCTAWQVALCWLLPGSCSATCISCQNTRQGLGLQGQHLCWGRGPMYSLSCSCSIVVCDVIVARTPLCCLADRLSSTPSTQAHMQQWCVNTYVLVSSTVLVLWVCCRCAQVLSDWLLLEALAAVGHLGIWGVDAMFGCASCTSFGSLHCAGLRFQLCWAVGDGPRWQMCVAGWAQQHRCRQIGL
jgi:hypothetical protein